MRTLHRQILSWYEANGRHDLPWRNTDDAYHIYVSEVMLQQTQVKTVLERYYHPFLERFPTLKALAEAPLEEVLKRWEGLGYYNRAKNLHRSAGMVERLPESIEALQQLPGIGKNTAHAIAAFAYRQPVPVMEANVRRILCRLHRYERPQPKTLWEAAYALVDKKNPFDYNQAMMDIGASCCTSVNPRCAACPLEALCRGKENPERYPARQSRSVPVKTVSVVIGRCAGGRLALYKRSGSFLHGLWGFKSTDTVPEAAHYLGEVRHAYTHFRLRCRVYLLSRSAEADERWFSFDEIENLPISKVDEKVLGLCKKWIGSRNGGPDV